MPAAQPMTQELARTVFRRLSTYFTLQSRGVYPHNAGATNPFVVRNSAATVAECETQ